MLIRWIDTPLTNPAALCIAAGNAGQERAEHDEDIGFIMGRVHASGRIAARELAADLEWNVVGNGVLDLSENELEIWYGPQDRFAVQVQLPGGDWTDPVEPGQFVENRQLDNGSFISIYNELYNPANRANYIAVYLSPQLREPAIVGVTGGPVAGPAAGARRPGRPFPRLDRTGRPAQARPYRRSRGLGVSLVLLGGLLRGHVDREQPRLRAADRVGGQPRR